MLFKMDNSSASSASISVNLDSGTLERFNIDYKDNSTRFYEVSRDFSKQFAHIYAARLNTFSNILERNVLKKWANKYRILKLCDLREKSVDCVIIGTLFKLQELKPSVLKEISDQLEILPQPRRSHFVHESDSIVLEDELQRIKLIGECINIHQVVTGVVCAILGSEDEDGIFTVKDVCWPECSIQKPLPKLDDDRYIVLASGLNLASTIGEHWFSLHLLLEWLAGVSGTSVYQKELSKIVKIIIAGGIFTNNANELTLKESNVIASAEAVDTYCAAISAVVPLDLMPGCKDPAGVMLPQKPLHYCLFPKATEYKSFHRVSNPYECNVGGVVCLGTSGEPIKDIMRFSKIDSDLEALKKTLQWRHMAPTAPDTLPCTPCYETDPFTIYNCPALYFCGNANEFSTTMYEGTDGQNVRIVSIPDFCATKTVAVINLKNMDCYSMKFA